MTPAAVITITILILGAFAALGFCAMRHFAETTRRPWDEGYPVRRRPEEDE